MKRVKGKNQDKKTRNVTKYNLFKSELWIPLRYLILLCLMFSLPQIYKIFTPLTIYPVIALLKLFFERVMLYGDIIIINLKTSIEIVPSCIAGSAYLLLLILNLSVPMTFKKRFFSLALSAVLLLTVNILRIFFLSILYVNNFIWFDITHKIFWFGLSVFFVVGIWFMVVKIYRITEIPVYSDIKTIISSVKIIN